MLLWQKTLLMIKKIVLATSVDGEETEPTNKYYPIENIQAKYKLFPSKLKKQFETKSFIIKKSCREKKEFLLQTKTFIHSYFIDKFKGVWQ